MTISVAEVDIATDRWSDLIAKENVMIVAFNTVAVTVNGGAAAGVARVAGTISANTVHAATLNGGTVEQPADLKVGSTATFTANTAYQGSNNSFGTITTIHALGANASHKMVMANNVSGKLLYTSLLDEIKLIHGSGSGIDADLLDGNDSTYYTAITDRLGYVPVNKAGDTITGVIRQNANMVFQTIGNIVATGANNSHKMIMANTTNGSFRFASLLDEIKLIHGSGSGIDADLLDGRDSTYYTDIDARLGYKPANKAGDTITGNLAVNGTLQSNGIFTALNGVNFGTASMMYYQGTELTLTQTNSIKMNNATIGSGRVSAAANAPTLVFSVSTNEFKGGKITAQCMNGANSHISEMLYTVSGNFGYVTEYAIIAPHGELVTYTANTAGSTLRVYATATVPSNITYQVTHLRG